MMYVIIGLGAAGAAAATAIRRYDKAAAITVVTEESAQFYSRVDLPDIVSGKLKENAAVLKNAAEFEALGIEIISGQRVEAILTEEKAVVFADGRRLAYDRLLLATGSKTIIPDIPGAGALGVRALWTMHQAQQLIDAAGHAKAAVVVGSGLIGLKTALALAARGLKVTVVEKLPRVMPRQLDEIGAEIIAAALQNKGVTIMTGAEVDAIEVASGSASGVVVNGSTLKAEIVVMAVGVKPNADLAIASGIAVGRGITVDANLRTSIPHIYAAGDCAEIIDPATGMSVVPAIWPIAVEQGETAAANMAGEAKAYQPSSAMNAVEVAGIPLISAGDPNPTAQDEVMTLTKAGRYRKVVSRDGVIRGVLFVGDVRQAGVLVNMCLRGQRSEGIKLGGALNYVDVLAV